MNESEKTFNDLTIKELISLEKWLIEDKSSQFPNIEFGINGDDEAKLWDNLTAKISDVRDAIIERVAAIQRNSFGDIANF